MVRDPSKEVCGWDMFRIYGSTAFPEITDLGFLTSHAQAKILDACGDDYTTRELILDVVARGPAWLPVQVLGEPVSTSSDLVFRNFQQRVWDSNL